MHPVKIADLAFGGWLKFGDISDRDGRLIPCGLVTARAQCYALRVFGFKPG